MDRLIELIKYIMLAFIQGVGEVLPISSSGHLLVARNLFNVYSEGIVLELILHLASLLALFIYYYKTILSLIKGCFKYVFYKNEDNKKDFIFVRGMIISLIPTCMIGLLLDDYLDLFFKYSFLIGVFLVLNSVNLYLIKDKKGDKKIDDLSLCSFFRIGLMQCFGLIPGFSRSGSALSGCFREGLEKEESKKFTFMMLFPLVIGSFVLNVGDVSFFKEFDILLCVAFILTFIITWFSIEILNKVIKSNKLHYFGYYCFVLGILVMFM